MAYCGLPYDTAVLVAARWYSIEAGTVRAWRRPMAHCELACGAVEMAAVRWIGSWPNALDVANLCDAEAAGAASMGPLEYSVSQEARAANGLPWADRWFSCAWGHPVDIPELGARLARDALQCRGWTNSDVSLVVSPLSELAPRWAVSSYLCRATHRSSRWHTMS